jgi:hypothetical protein
MKNIVEKSFLTGISGFLLLFIIANLSLISQESGWENKGGYLEQKLKVGSITFLQYSKDGKHFYTLSDDNLFRKWESESGVLVNEKQIISPTFKVKDVSLSPNELNIALSYTGNFELQENFAKINLNDLTQIDSIAPKNYFNKNGFDGDYCCNENSVSFITDSFLLININYLVYQIDESLGSNWHNRLEIRSLIDFSIDTIMNTYGAYSPKIAVISDRIISYCSNIKYLKKDEHNETYMVKRTLLRTTNYHENFSITFAEYDKSIIPTFLRTISTDFNKSIFVGYSNINELYFWDIITKSLMNKIKIGSSNSNQLIDDIIFVSDTTYFIIAGNDSIWGSSIKILNYQTGEVIDTFKFDVRDNKWKLASLLNSQSFLSGSKDGIVRKYTLNISSISEYPVIFKSSIISPNPNSGSGIIKFTNEEAGNIEIELFALTGTKSQTIVNNWYSEGEHEIPFL